ncbi:E3 ubiquitin-protein ligase 3-Mar [Echinococcus granulosus]|uniref:E3 ubiquitin-protein ligase 3-Mar n=1 Tax=Echinococcus granulosus TaxID=6210 RepID=W6V157_ECHGR|nr:E3 ubiquitin-protein ligase 3-Mar [Echinococcus granulosus]EUB59554.1 E3 ubiquitin-protein ligase 3-Mar [Echinococcus granulosus]
MVTPSAQSLEKDHKSSICIPEEALTRSVEATGLNLNQSISSADDTSKISIFELSIPYTSTPTPALIPAEIVPTNCAKSVRPSIAAPRCRICYEEGLDPSPLISPCRCKGTVGLLHKTCLEHWLQVSQTISCEICGYSYNLRPKSPLPTEPNTSKTSSSFAIGRVNFLREWFRSRLVQRDVITDCIFLVLLASITCIGVYFCVTTSLHFLHIDNSMLWQVPVLIGLAVVLLLIFILWIILAVRHHMRAYLSHRRHQEDRIREFFHRRALERHWRFSVYPRPRGSSFALPSFSTPNTTAYLEEREEHGGSDHRSMNAVIPPLHLYAVAERGEVEEEEGKRTQSIVHYREPRHSAVPTQHQLSLIISGTIKPRSRNHEKYDSIQATSTVSPLLTRLVQSYHISANKTLHFHDARPKEGSRDTEPPHIRDVDSER